MNEPSKAYLEQHNQQQIDYFANNYKQTMQPAEGTYYTNRQVDELLSFANIGKDELILDVGCGIGRYTLPIARRGYTIEGLDLTQALLDQLQQHAGDSLHVPTYCADVMFPPDELIGRYDVLVGFFTLHHLHDIPGCYKAMTRLLKPGGRIVFLEPNAFNPLYYLQIAITPRMTWQGDGGIVYMRQGYLFRAMRDAGLTDLQVQRFGFFPPAISNQPAGAKIERVLEAFPLWRPLLPFQMFMGRLPAAGTGG